ncbi:Lrp/AsnC family transcriptional regulator [Parahaliea mediterranea]|uniref:Lrp/AsnC family transcriptional regulator n=1 Tax=Parahaliea mediterranea TaxID=651086 RepID=A0A939IM20_9GAMM|nr:Lrp/AsnC family transcriptional regulator [Parahaliea mediterranea]MBN7796578.1 Lrp/AsnC family transcriptional regulator [Parahaliea mediterranea]
MAKKKSVKLDAINRKILATIHLQSDITNAKLAELVNLSPAACSQRTKALRDAGYYFNCHTEVDLDRICEHVIAYVEFTLRDNSLPARRRFEAAIETMPEFMDCLRLSGDTDYISFTCCSDVNELNRLCDELSGNEALGISRVVTRIVLERPKFYLGYPIEKLKWL